MTISTRRALEGQQVGPQIGVPPSQENVPVERLQVDAAYQRATDGPSSRKIIAGMVAQWDWRLCQPLVVSRRADGALFILDGQHRHAGAIARGDIPFLPCVLLSSLAAAEEAATFVAINTRRQRLSQSDIFHGLLATGDAKAIEVQDLLTQTGWRVRRSSSTAQFHAGDMNCAPMLVRRIAQDGVEAVRFALVTLRRAWPDKPINAIATFLKGMIEAHLRLEDDDRRDDLTHVASVLAARTHDEWLLRATRIRGQNRALSAGSALGLAVARAVRGEDDPHAHKPDRPAPAAVTKVTVAQVAKVVNQHRPAPAFKAPAFNREGKAWCAQCDRLRTRPEATTCTDAHCKLKGSL